MEYILVYIKLLMKLPEQYKNLTIDQKRTVVANLIAQYWDKWIHNLTDNLSDEQVEFLFKYFFTESKEQREKMWHNMQKKYEATLKEIEYIAKKIQMLNIKAKELVSQEKDKREFMKKK